MGDRALAPLTGGVAVNRPVPLLAAALLIALGAATLPGLRAPGPEPAGPPSADPAPSPPVDLASRPAKGPELERWYFGRWFEPEPPELTGEFRERAVEELSRMPAEAPATGAVTSWQLEGPFTMQQSSGARWTGRVLDLDVPTGAPVRVAAASGGLWTYEFIIPVPLSDDVPSLAIGSVTTDPQDPDHMIIGTGEMHIRSGTGVWETRDGGDTWTQRITGGQMPFCVRVRFDPHDTQRVFAAGAGLWRSTNGGQTWAIVDQGTFTDMDFVLTVANRMVTYEMGTGVRYSTNGGTSFTTLGAFPGSPDLGRGSVAFAPVNYNVLYCAVAADYPDGAMQGVYRTSNGGATWTDVSPPTNYMGKQGWYDNVLDVGHFSENLVLAGGVQLMRTTNGGATWTEVTDPDLHVDYHVIRWSADGTKVYVGNDGGWMHSSDQGLNWTSTTNVVPITQFYHFDTAKNAPQVMVGGSQDNGFARTSNGGSTWDRPFGADGGCVVIDPFVPSRWWVTNGVYSGGLDFRRLRTTDSGGTWQTQDAGIAASGQWVPEIRDDGVNPVWLYTTSAGWLYRSTDLGANWASMTGSAFPAEISSLTLTDWNSTLGSTIYACLDSNVHGQRLRVYTGTWTERGNAFSDRVRKVSVQGDDPNRAYALIDGTANVPKIWRTTNRGQGWTDITGNLPGWIPVADLVRHPTDPDRLYLGTAFGCFRSTNGGALWTRWNNGMPEATIVTEMVGVDSLATSGRFYVYASTYGRGIWSREISGDDPVDVAEVSAPPARVALEAPRPNPARGRTALAFSLPAAAEVDLSVYDVAGRRVATLAQGAHAAGRHEVPFEARGLAAGVYWARLETPGARETERIVLVR